MPLDFNELRQLLLTIAQTDIAELTLKSDEFELTVRKAVGMRNQPSPVIELQGTDDIVTGSSSPATLVTPDTAVNSVSSRVVETPVTGRVMQSLGSALPSIEPILVEVPSPMVGTFYRSPAPAEPPFVEVGDRIRSGQTVCIIEAMKLMNEIEAEVSGRIIEILVQDGEPVEYGQPLMRINPGQ